MSRLLFLGCLAVLTAAGGYLRFNQADVLPPGLEYDEGLQGLDAANVWAGNLAIYFREAYREPLYVYLAAPFVGLLGQTAQAIRFPAMIAGTLTIPITAGLVADLFAGSIGSPRARLAGLVAGGLVAFSLWPIIMSRTGIPGAVLPPIAAGVVWLFGRAMRDGRGWLPAGFLLGIAPYSYLPSRLLPVVIGGTLLVDGILRPRKSVLVLHWRGVLLAAATSVLMFAPLGLYYLADPVGLLGRASHVSVFRSTVPEGNSGLAVLRTTGQSIAAFFWSGDTNWYHNLPGRPIFDPLIAMLAVAGLIVLMQRAVRMPELLISVWLVVMLLPGILSDDNNPNTARMVGLIPVFFTLPALALAQLLRVAHWSPATSRYSTVISLLVVATILVNSAASTVGAWDAWVAAPETFAARSGESVDVVRILNERAGEPGTVFLLPISNAWPASRNYQQRSFQYLYRGPAPYAFHRVDDSETPNALSAICNRCRKMTTVVWKTGPHIDADPKGLVPVLLGRAGLLTTEEQRPGYDLLTYSLPNDAWLASETLVARQDTIGDRLRLTGAFVQQSWSGRAIGISTRWRLGERTSTAERLSYRLRDSAGATIAQVDRPLISNQHVETPGWDRGSEEIDRALLPVPPGTPPGSYRIAVVAYGGGAPVEVDLGPLELSRPSVLYEPFELDLDLELNDPHPTNKAVGLFYGPDRIASGENVSLIVYWRAAGQPAATRDVRLALVDSSGRLLVERRYSAGPAGYPPAEWQVGEIVAQPLELPLGRSVLPGPTRLEVWIDSVRIAERRLLIG